MYSRIARCQTSHFARRSLGMSPIHSFPSALTCLLRVGTLDQTRLQENLLFLILLHTLDITKQSRHAFARPQTILTSSSISSLSIARIFGGFSESFFSTYHKYLPKTEPVDQYELRMDLYELFHYLNHTLIFGVCVQMHVCLEHQY